MKYLIKRLTKKLLRGFYGKAGRNNKGIIVVRGKSSGLKRNLFLIDNKRILNSKGTIIKVFWDYRILKLIGLVLYSNGLSSFILLSKAYFQGQRKTGFDFKIISGYSSILGNLKIGNLVNNIELLAGQGIKLAKANGVFVIKVGYEKENSILKLQSGLMLKLSNKCIGVIGEMSAIAIKDTIRKKAGFSRNQGKRPKVRGVAMNPVDHPHGGGNGKKTPSAIQKSPWGWQTKGIKTRKKWKKNLIK